MLCVLKNKSLDIIRYFYSLKYSQQSHSLVYFKFGNKWINYGWKMFRWWIWTVYLNNFVRTLMKISWTVVFFKSSNLQNSECCNQGQGKSMSRKYNVMNLIYMYSKCFVESLVENLGSFFFIWAKYIVRNSEVLGKVKVRKKTNLIFCYHQFVFLYKIWWCLELFLWNWATCKVHVLVSIYTTKKKPKQKEKYTMEYWFTHGLFLLNQNSLYKVSH